MNVNLFVQNVKNLCEERGVSLTAACKESGVGTSFIPDIKRGRIPSIDKFEKLALYLDVTISQLIGDARNSLVTVQYSAPPKDTIEEIYEILDVMQPKVIQDFKSYINSMDPPISISAGGPYTAILEARLQNFDRSNAPSQITEVPDTSVEYLTIPSADLMYNKLNPENRALVDQMIEKLLKSQSGD